MYGLEVDYSDEVTKTQIERINDLVRPEFEKGDWIDDLPYEEQVLVKHSSDRLRRHELDRFAKKDHLAGMKLPAEDVKKILDQLYGPEE